MDAEEVDHCHADDVVACADARGDTEDEGDPLLGLPGADADVPGAEEGRGGAVREREHSSDPSVRPPVVVARHG